MAGETGPLVRGWSWAGVYAFDAKDGKQLWRFGTRGENQHVVATHIDGVAIRVANPIAGPLTVLLDGLLAGDLDARRERRRVEVAVKAPAFEDDVHLLAGRAPVRVAALGAAKFA
jgi:outer membrane protein assembly factor BamB